MKKLKSQTISVAIVLVLIISSLFVLSSCKSNKGYRNGFVHDPWQRAILCAAKGEKLEYDVNDVTLDFYFGWLSGARMPELYNYPFYERTAVGVTIFFRDARWVPPTDESDDSQPDDAEPTITKAVADYHDINGQYFAGEVPTDEFFGQSFRVKSRWIVGRKFEHNETITVPPTVFARSYSAAGEPLKYGAFLFAVRGWCYVKRLPPLVFDGQEQKPNREIEEGYHSYFYAELKISYEYINESTIRLFQRR